MEDSSVSPGHRRLGGAFHSAPTLSPPPIWSHGFTRASQGAQMRAKFERTRWQLPSCRRTIVMRYLGRRRRHDPDRSRYSLKTAGTIDVPEQAAEIDFWKTEGPPPVALLVRGRYRFHGIALLQGKTHNFGCGSGKQWAQMY